MQRKRYFKTGDFFHICNKSISNFKILNDENNCHRFIKTLGYYNNLTQKTNLGNYLKKETDFYPDLLIPNENSLVKYISFSLMPDHYHLLIKILHDNCLSKYINNIQNSFSRYFNLKFNRKGPLWQSRFKAIKIKTNEQLLHVCRYVNINSTTSGLVKNPEDWKFSSYKNIITNSKYLSLLTEISIRKRRDFKKFAENHKDYQRRLKLIKKMILE
jgi:putative transposase